MRGKFFTMTLIVVFSILMITSGQMVTAHQVADKQGSGSDDQKYVGTWVGSYSTEKGVTGDLSYILSKDDKGQWSGKVKYTNQDGEQSAEFKSLQIADGKMKGKIESPDGQVEATIEGQFQGDRLEGTYTVLPKGSTETAEKGTWKVTKSKAPKPGQ